MGLESNFVIVNDSTRNSSYKYDYIIKSHKGYINNISEKMYEDELKLFIEHINNKNIDYPNNLEKDFKVLKLYIRQKIKYVR